MCKCHDMFCTCKSTTKGTVILEKVQKLTDSEILDLYAFLKHGSEDHQEWLLKALFHYFKDTPKPDYKT